MAKLSELIGTKTVQVPNTSVEITVQTDLTWSDWLANKAIEDDEDRGVDAFQRLIQDWNIEDDDGVKLPITSENIKKLPTSVALVLLAELNKGILERSKKKAD